MKLSLRSARRTVRGLTPTFLVVLALSAALLVPSCKDEGDEVQKQVASAFTQLTNALAAKDVDTLWEMTDPTFQKFCDELHQELAEAEKMARTFFPEWQHKGLLEKLAYSRLGGAKSGKELFGKLLDFAKLREGDAVVAGLAHEPAQVSGSTASIKTAAGETFTFVRDERGRWRTDIYAALQNAPLIDTLRGNAKTLRENVARLRELYRATTDPRTPEGAFNSLRVALEKGDGDVSQALLDEAGRKALTELRTKLEAIQEQKKPAREAALKRAGIPTTLDLTVAASTDRKLAAALTKAGRLADVLEMDASSAVYFVKLVDRSEAIVVTTEASEVPLVREKDGLWHLADVAGIIRQQLTERLAPAKSTPVAGSAK